MHSDLSKVLKVHDVFLVRRLVRCFGTCVAGLYVSLRYRAACYEKADKPFDLSPSTGQLSDGRLGLPWRLQGTRLFKDLAGA